MLRYAQSLGLPTNIILTRLPDSEIALNYPTIGSSSSTTSARSLR